MRAALLGLALLMLTCCGAVCAPGVSERRQECLTDSITGCQVWAERCYICSISGERWTQAPVQACK